jgi:hypothetical protein
MIIDELVKVRKKFAYISVLRINKSELQNYWFCTEDTRDVIDDSTP